MAKRERESGTARRQAGDAVSIDAALGALERLLGVSIVLLDRGGFFHSGAGRALLGRRWQSHRKNPVCALGFSNERCIGHCRHEVNALGEDGHGLFVHTCWKGVQEVVVPLVHDDQHVGSLFAGAWRRTGTDAPLCRRLLPRAAVAAYRALPEFDPVQAEALGRALTLAARGLTAQLEHRMAWDVTPGSRKAEVRRFLRRNAAKPVRLEDVAELLHLSPPRASHVVRELFGKSFRDLVRDERMNRAKCLLETTDVPVGEVARLVGVDDPYHFNRLFKACVGMPPGKYRRLTSRQGVW
jgi:AraC-like DNA-binding protein